MKKILPALCLLVGLALGSGCCTASPFTGETYGPLTIEASAWDFQPGLMNALVEALAEEAPLNAGFAVGVMAIPEPVWGDCQWSEMYQAYLIRIDGRQTMASIIETLAHEWAHAMAYDATQEDDHGELWGVAYSRTYRITLEAAEAYHAALHEEEILDAFLLDEPDESPAEDE